ncbi:PilC/PilY family type IV pilus protein [Archangium lansingense]|uniref:PilC/PilY family type IV pilus protein n=1 Tax=Archangium lansingense TaxID=2995310 RepID=A0ABT4AFX1_9BACT|nr:PilC/PilY family type IV pilus protein [Archangium lansinium]MCY1080579.1 PilC/PilY family type IV pilus protein [Archangium lansinium]
MFRKLTLSLVAILVVLLRADTASAIDQAACCLPTTSRLDALMNPTRGSDEKFFSRPGGPPNILFIIDTSGSMHSWPKTWPTTKGCSDSFLNGLGYASAEAYPRLWTGLNSQSDAWFATNSYYEAPSEGYGVIFGNAPDNTQTWTSVSNACSSISGIGSSDRSTCQSCLDTKGYYIHNSSTRRVKGNFLNFYAPRDSGAVKVMADVIRDLREVRFGVLGFQTRAAKTCWGKKSGTNNQCLCIQQPMGPTCAKSYPLDNSSVENNRNSVLNDLTNVNDNNSNGLGWDGCNTPLADALYSAGYYFQSKGAPTPFSTYLGTHPTSANFSAADGVCFECGFNAVILLTDGEPYDEGKVVNLPDAIKNDTTPCEDCSPSHLHKVAKMMWEKDLRFDMDGQQRVATYTIGFSEDVEDSKLLQETARLGGGKFFPARSTSELKRVMLTILDDINTRNTAFSSAAVNTLQTQSVSATAIIPRMMPAKNGSWSGRLYRYEQFNEFVEDQDKNADGDRADTFLVDKSGTMVAEDNSSEYRKVLSTSGGPGGAPVYGGAAEPFWEANAKLQALGHKGRKIWTVTDNNGGGSKDGLMTEKDSVVEFKLTNMSQLRQYLAVSGSPLCPTGVLTTYKPGLILEKMQMAGTLGLAQAVTLMTAQGLVGVPANPTTQDAYDLLCSALVMQYVRGQDLFDENGDGKRDDTRPSVLGDIFHSSPVVVDPPVDKFLCDIGVSNQCVSTLFATQNKTGVPSTEMVTYTQAASCNVATPTVRDAYDAWHFINRKRERLILVGANDGMLHAFSDGQGQEDSKCEVTYSSTAAGGGTERWAFIPADLLSRLQDMLQGHAYYIDGDIMVRDIWSDENNDGKKQMNEYHTVAVVAEGRGGTHYFALEIQWDGASTLATSAKTQPSFRWMFPQPCTDEALRFGKTLMSLSPKPPPIGPVLLQSSSGLARHEDKSVLSVERWVAVLSGGWSPANEKGRGIYMVDVWNGTVPDRRDNLLWKWEYSESFSGTSDPRKDMTYGFAAPVALADYGSNTKVRFDGFFDTAVVGDLGGQLWTLRFHEAGVRDGTTKLIGNWSGARAFVMDRAGVNGGNDQSVRSRAPFHYLTSLAMQPENRALRAFVGSGNRYQLLDNGAGICRFDNPQACSKLGCGSTLSTYKLTRNDTDYQRLSNEWVDRAFKAGRYTAFSSATTSSTNFCGSVGDTDMIKAEYEYRQANSCPKPTGGGTVSYEFARTKVQCGQDASGVFDCRVSDPGNTLNMNDLDLSASSTPSSLGKNRFYGIWAYGGVPERMFDENGSGSSKNKAADYDSRRLTDTGGSATSGDLTDVTNVKCDGLGNCSCETGKTCSPKVLANADSYGWFYEYEGLPHKTASGAAVLSSCTLWNSMYPGSSSSGACASASSNQARLFQADFVTGAPNCAAGFLDGNAYVRYQNRSVLAPPPEPAMSIQVSKTGQVVYGVNFFEPGKGQATGVQISSDRDVLQYIYELPISRSLHTCRHDSKNGGQSACIPSEM